MQPDLQDKRFEPVTYEHIGDDIAWVVVSGHDEEAIINSDSHYAGFNVYLSNLFILIESIL